MLKLEHEFLDPGDAKGDEVKATWGRLGITLDGARVTRCISGTDTVRDSIYGPLYPVAEWLAARWWSLLFELDNGTNSRDPFYARRHDLQLAEQGFALPPLWFQSRGNSVLVASRPFKHPGAAVEFTEPGKEVPIPRDELSGTLSAFINAVVHRLAAKGVKETTLQADWNAILGADEEERRFCIAAAQMGLDPYDVRESVAKAIEHAGGSLPTSVHEDLFALATGSDLGTWSALVARLLKTTKRNVTDTTALNDLRRSLARTRISTDRPAYQLGYARAEKVRELLRLNGDLFGSHHELLSAFSLDDEASITKEWEPPRLRGALAYAKSKTPVFVLNKGTNDRSQRFALARAIHEHLFSTGANARIITEVKSTDQSINRAFAAGLLAPKRELGRRITGKVVYGEQVDALADEFGVETDVIRNNIQNFNLAEVEEMAF